MKLRDPPQMVRSESVASAGHTAEEWYRLWLNSVLSAGDRLGPYEILSLLGTGGMGEVWKARDTRLNRLVAIKCLKAPHGARFEQEARAIAALNHSHICQIFDIGPDYLVLEFVEGVPFEGPLPVRDALQVALQIASALEAAHKQGILHRDLKPANVLVTEAGAKLLDFGVAKFMSDDDNQSTGTLDGAVVGTASYMSPEQTLGKAARRTLRRVQLRSHVVRGAEWKARVQR